MKIFFRSIPVMLLMTAILPSKAQSPCDTVTGNACRSIVTDTVFNPYVMGVLGNWKPNKAFTFYDRRAESDPATAINLRTAGAYNEFTPYWDFRNASLKEVPDTFRWVWNSEVTLFNRNGGELETRDPLGRYSAGQFGYLTNLPIAVVQNSRYRESAFEGFEDYHFATMGCGNDCPPNRHIDFSSYKSSIVTDEKHTGRSSLRLNAGEQAGVSFLLTRPESDTIMPQLSFGLKSNSCTGAGALDKVSTDSRVLIPTFSPSPGQKMVVSAWVKEAQDCKCISYVNNQLVVIIKGPGETQVSKVFNASGSIIEGWQRYEGIFELPADANYVTVSMRSIGSATVYFDDLRIHPFNANMKSFVFHPVNMRLMAEMDENNYATFYEYDDEGTLTRVKKETQRGIKTIKETRSAMVKE
ncbi:MAG: hypothetical protein J7578_10160 [Chitinophagaceae bacterium]|nr:hypothetical protein [Chitinophagaceae bacterium]